MPGGLTLAAVSYTHLDAYKRQFEEQTLLEMAEHATDPVMNGLTNRTHPCQIMDDVLTYDEHRRPIAGKTGVWAGVGTNT